MKSAVGARRVAQNAIALAVREARAAGWSWDKISAALGGTPSGDAYTFAELQQMAENAGFARSEMHELPPTIERVVVSYK